MGEETDECEEKIVKFVEIRFGVDEDGSGISITIRDDEGDIERLTELALRIYSEISGKKSKEEKRNEVV